MGILDYFKPVNTITPDEVRTLIKEKGTHEYCLLDVRQPGEYAAGHLPGARLIPLGELQARFGEMDRDRVTITYCRSGSRSRAAAGLLTGAGFREVYNMKGGIAAYNGIVASGEPESGMFCFQQSSAPAELAAVAWLLENGSLRFLDRLQVLVQEKTVGKLIGRLDQARRANKAAILNLYGEVANKKPAADFPKGVLDAPPEDIMAGCVKVESALRWAEGKNDREVLEAMMALEANTLDLYLKMERIVKEEAAKKVFRFLAEQETPLLDTVASALDRTL